MVTHCSKCCICPAGQICGEPSALPQHYWILPGHGISFHRDAQNKLSYGAPCSAFPWFLLRSISCQCDSGASSLLQRNNRFAWEQNWASPQTMKNLGCVRFLHIYKLHHKAGPDYLSFPSSSRGNKEQLDPLGLTSPLSIRLTTETEKWVKPAIMAGPKIASERRTCGQALLSTAWAGLGGQQPLALAQNGANALGLLGKKKCFSSCPYQGKGHTVGRVLYLQKRSQSSECNRD